MCDAVSPDVRSSSDRFPASTASDNEPLHGHSQGGIKVSDVEDAAQVGSGEAVRKQRRCGSFKASIDHILTQADTTNLPVGAVM